MEVQVFEIMNKQWILQYNYHFIPKLGKSFPSVSIIITFGRRGNIHGIPINLEHFYMSHKMNVFYDFIKRNAYGKYRLSGLIIVH